MKVAYITHYGDLYGANRCMLDLLLQARAAHGVEPHVLLAREGPMLEVLERHAVPYAVIPFLPWVERRVYMGGPHHRVMQHLRHWRKQRRRTLHNRALLPRLAEQARAWNIDLLHVNSSVIGFGADLARALRVPWVWHVRELFGLHYGYQVDGGDRAFAATLRKADAVIAMSAAVRAEVLHKVGADRPMEVIHDGVATAEQAATLAVQAEERWEQEGPFRFVLAGLFHPSKGQLEAVEALASVRAQGVDAELVLAGTGRMEPVQQRIRELDLQQHVELPGFVDDAYALFLGAHAALTCSKYEAYGRVTLEALTTGIPVIGHASGGTPELIENGHTGFLYNTPEQLAEHMQQLAGDRTLARGMGQAALRSKAVQRTIGAMTDDVLRVYWSVLRRTEA